MKKLKPGYLVIQTSDGENIPCSAESITIELVGDGTYLLGAKKIRKIAKEACDYFRKLQREVTVEEFTHQLESLLVEHGFNVAGINDLSLCE